LACCFLRDGFPPLQLPHGSPGGSGPPSLTSSPKISRFQAVLLRQPLTASFSPQVHFPCLSKSSFSAMPFFLAACASPRGFFAFHGFPLKTDQFCFTFTYSRALGQRRTSSSSCLPLDDGSAQAHAIFSPPSWTSFLTCGCDGTSRPMNCCLRRSSSARSSHEDFIFTFPPFD